MPIMSDQGEVLSSEAATAARIAGILQDMLDRANADADAAEQQADLAQQIADATSRADAARSQDSSSMDDPSQDDSSMYDDGSQDFASGYIDDDDCDDIDDDEGQFRGGPPPAKRGGGMALPKGLPMPFPGLGRVLSMLPALPRLFGVGEIEVGEPYPPLPTDFHDAIPTSARRTLVDTRMHEPYSALAHGPALLGSQMLLQQAAHLCACYPELCEKLGEMLETAREIADAEAGRIMGHPEASRAILRARNSSDPQVIQAMNVTRQLLGDNDE